MFQGLQEGSLAHRSGKEEKKKKEGNYLLDHTAAVHLPSKVVHATLHSAGEMPLLILIAVLKELLYDIVSKHILHKLQFILLDFTENPFFLVAVCRLQLVLDKSGAVLVSAELYDVIVNVLKPLLVLISHEISQDHIP